MKYLILLALLTGCASQPQVQQQVLTAQPTFIQQPEYPYVAVWVTEEGYIFYTIPEPSPSTDI